MKTVFDIRLEKNISKIQKEIKKGKSNYRTKWGLYGSNDWFNNLQSENLILTIDGFISKLIMTGHNDFPEFEVTSENIQLQFERKGLEAEYKIGKQIKILAIKRMFVYPISGLENSLIPLRIEIDE